MQVLLHLRRDVVSEHWSLKTVDCFVQVVSNTGLTLYSIDTHFDHQQQTAFKNTVGKRRNCS